jgi:predicted peroxiredoxin
MSRQEQLIGQIHNINDKMLGFATSSQRAAQSYEAHMILYRVAASAGDKEGLERERDTLHTLLDVILDSGVHVAQCEKDIAELVKALSAQ